MPVYVCVCFCLFVCLFFAPRCCSEFLSQCVEHFDVSQLTKLVPVVENLLTVAIRDADSTARKVGRR